MGGPLSSLGSALALQPIGRVPKSPTMDGLTNPASDIVAAYRHLRDEVTFYILGRD